jgi:adenylate cyclase class 2
VPTNSALRTHEVEVKYRADAAQLAEALWQRGVELSVPVHQDDQAYAPAAWEYGMSKLGVTFARLRTQAGRHLFTVKRPVDNEMVCLEHETVVADRDQMHEALLVMGYRATVRIVKARQTARWDDVSVCVDQVDGLGGFVELEQVVRPDQSGIDVQRRLDELARSLQVPVQRTMETYDSLVRASEMSPRKGSIDAG